MLRDYHITLIIVGVFILTLVLIHTIRWTAIGVKHGWPPPRPPVRGGETPPPPNPDGSHRAELSKGGALDGRRDV